MEVFVGISEYLALVLLDPDGFCIYELSDSHRAQFASVT